MSCARYMVGVMKGFAPMRGIVKPRGLDYPSPKHMHNCLCQIPTNSPNSRPLFASSKHKLTIAQLWRQLHRLYSRVGVSTSAADRSSNHVIRHPGDNEQKASRYVAASAHPGTQQQHSCCCSQQLTLCNCLRYWSCRLLHRLWRRPGVPRRVLRLRHRLVLCLQLPWHIPSKYVA